MMRIYREHRQRDFKVYAWSDSNFEFATHWHTQIEIVCVLTGTLEAQINGESYSLNQGDIVLCGENDIHSYHNSTGRSMFIMLSPSFIESSSQILTGKYLKTHCIPAEQVDSNIQGLITFIFKNYANEKNLHDSFKTIIFHGSVMVLLGNILQKLEFEKGNQKINLNVYDYMRNAYEYIDSNYCDPDITLEKIASHIGISSCYLSRCFKMYSGYSLTEYINRKRIIKAEKLLKDNNKSITEISMECGYGSLRNFNRVYKSFVGKTPGEARSGNYAWNSNQSLSKKLD